MPVILRISPCNKHHFSRKLRPPNPPCFLAQSVWVEGQSGISTKIAQSAREKGRSKQLVNTGERSQEIPKIGNNDDNKNCVLNFVCLQDLSDRSVQIIILYNISRLSFPILISLSVSECDYHQYIERTTGWFTVLFTYFFISYVFPAP